MKYASREGFAAYGLEGIYKVSAVNLVTRVIDNRKRHKQQDQPQQKKQSAFDAIFREKQEEIQKQDSIVYQVAGYTKDAIAYNYTVKKREYV